MAHTERERKFFVPKLPRGLSKYPHYLMHQGYLVTGDDGSEARLRKIAAGRRTQHLLTVKRPYAEGARTEVEVPIPAGDFRKLWPLTKKQRLEKVRYRIPYGHGLTIEVDRYRGRLRGLAVAEVEFPSPRSAKSFRPPDWFGPDITNRAAYGNRSLAQNGLPKRLNSS